MYLQFSADVECILFILCMLVHELATFQTLFSISNIFRTFQTADTIRIFYNLLWLLLWFQHIILNLLLHNGRKSVIRTTNSLYLFNPQQTWHPFQPMPFSYHVFVWPAESFNIFRMSTIIWNSMWFCFWRHCTRVAIWIADLSNI